MGTKGCSVRKGVGKGNLQAKGSAWRLHRVANHLNCGFELLVRASSSTGRWVKGKGDLVEEDGGAETAMLLVVVARRGEGTRKRRGWRGRVIIRPLGVAG